MILLDSSILIELFRKKNKEETLFYSLSKTTSNFCISSISHYEIGRGNRESHLAYWNKLLTQITILPFDTVCSEIAIEIYQELRGTNKLIDIADILIGSTALANNISIATLNKKHFERIKKLKIVN